MVTSTDSTGVFTLNVPVTGKRYYVHAELPGQYQLTQPAPPADDYPVTVTPGQTSGGFDFGLLPPPTVSGLSLSPASLTGGQASTGTVTLSAPAPTGGLTVSLVSDTGAAGVLGSVTVPASATAATFPITTQAVSRQVSANITAKADGTSQTQVLAINPPDSRDVTSQLTVTRSGLFYVNAFQTYNGTITLTNKTGRTILGPLDVVLMQLTAGIMVTDADGVYRGSPYIIARDSKGHPIASLAPGASVRVPISLYYPGSTRIVFGIQVLSANL